jgi:hypothetical protein
MNNDLINFINALINKRLRYLNNINKDDLTGDVILEVLEKGIEKVEDNQLTINGIIAYHINKAIRYNKKIYNWSEDIYFDINQEKNELYECQYNKLEEIFNSFKNDNPKLNQKHLHLFELIKINGMSYKDIGDNVSDRKRVERIFTKFKNYIKEKNIKLIDFYE